MNNIFINPELRYLRSGWRIGLFLLIVTGCTVIIVLPMSMVLKQIPELKMMSIQLFLSYCALTIATWIMLRFVDKRPFHSVGLHFNPAWKKELSLGVIMGAGMMSTIVAVMYASGMMTIQFRELEWEQIALIFLNSLFLYIVVGYGEELMFRGYLFQVFCEGTNRIVPVVTVSVVFAFAHAGNPNVSAFGLVNVGLAGVWLSVGYLKTNALWLPIGMHFSWNFFQGFVYSLPVSGTTSEKEQIGRAMVTGPEWLTGGTFGPEGGALATLLLIVAIVLILKGNIFRSAEGIWTYEQWREDRKNSVQSSAITNEGTIVS